MYTHAHTHVREDKRAGSTEEMRSIIIGVNWDALYNLDSC